jgi:hypothetical protein
MAVSAYGEVVPSSKALLSGVYRQIDDCSLFVTRAREESCTRSGLFSQSAPVKDTINPPLSSRQKRQQKIVHLEKIKNKAGQEVDTLILTGLDKVEEEDASPPPASSRGTTPAIGGFARTPLGNSGTHGLCLFSHGSRRAFSSR